MSALAIDLNQFKSLRSSEFGVKLDHLDSEGDFIDDTLPGAVTTGEQFQIFDPVVLPVAVDVMDGFLGEEIAANVLRHDETVLENIERRAPIFSRNDQADVAVANDALSRHRVGVFRLITGSSESRSAFFAAKVPSRVQCPTGLALNRECFSALDAREGVFGVRSRFSARMVAGQRAVNWVFSEFFPVFGKIGRFVRKGSAAMLAREGSRFDLGGGPTVNRFVGSLTSTTAKATTKFAFSRYVKNVSAVLAGQIGVCGFSLFLLASNAAKALVLFSGSRDNERGAAILACSFKGHIDVLSKLTSGQDCTYGMSLSTAKGV